jgi:hypothetical protein
MNSSHIGAKSAQSGVRPNQWLKAIHLQRKSEKPGLYKNLCGTGNGPGSKNFGEPNPDSVFYNALLHQIYRCCPTCIKYAIHANMISVTINFKPTNA